jgi:hypothetical protein
MKSTFAAMSLFFLLLLSNGRATIGDCYKCCREVQDIAEGEDLCLHYKQARCDDCASGNICMGSTDHYKNCTGYGWETWYALNESCTCICEDTMPCQAFAHQHGDYVVRRARKVCP